MNVYVYIFFPFIFLYELLVIYFPKLTIIMDTVLILSPVWEIIRTRRQR